MTKEELQGLTRSQLEELTWRQNAKILLLVSMKKSQMISFTGIGLAVGIVLGLVCG